MKIFIYIVIGIIKVYKLFISPFIRPSCRYLPTCSEYFIDSLKVHGLFIGFYMGIKRILSCHPFKILGGGSGFDPVKKNKGIKNGH
ncbi:MAG: membrane protein insertion efficiency factor YidD [Candidatus Pelagibacter sp. TMED275]|nr:MAG: membrane protein insertion efficiency factor YidD [Candidatus Pelagibacter sp. TMED275]|tara:strand:- start:2876 stop:3133 length:258 start_codon:yes stop_codon:yes gene_type:complete